MIGGVGNHLRFKPPSEEELSTYNILQRLSYSRSFSFCFRS